MQLQWQRCHGIFGQVDQKSVKEGWVWRPHKSLGTRREWLDFPLLLDESHLWWGEATCLSSADEFGISDMGAKAVASVGAERRGGCGISGSWQELGPGCCKRLGKVEKKLKATSLWKHGCGEGSAKVTLRRVQWHSLFGVCGGVRQEFLRHLPEIQHHGYPLCGGGVVHYNEEALQWTGSGKAQAALYFPGKFEGWMKTQILIYFLLWLSFQVLPQSGSRKKEANDCHAQSCVVGL